MTVLVFVLVCGLQTNRVSTGPNDDWLLGWLVIRRHGLKWSFENFDIAMLAFQVFLATGLTWAYSRARDRRIGG
jgi:hypothetical protein